MQTIERRLPPKRHTGPFIDLSAFKSIPFSLYGLSSFVAFLGIYTVRASDSPLLTRGLKLGCSQVLTYIDVSAVSEGISEDFSFYLLAIANGFSALGRIVGGIVADRTGPLNVMIPATFLAGIMTYIWPFATSVGGNIGVAIVYGYVVSIYSVRLR